MIGYHLSIPARINVLGNPTDANEGDFATITAAVNLRAHAVIKPGDSLQFSIVDPSENQFVQIAADKFPLKTTSLPCTGQTSLMQAAYNRLYKYSSEFRDRIDSGNGFHIKAWSHVPRQSGLGGSSLFVLLTLAGLRKLFELDPSTHNDYVLAELTQRTEALEMGITCGYADRYVPLFGGLAYLDYRGKLLQSTLDEEPYATYERLDSFVAKFPIVAIMTGIQHDSGDVHGRMRPVYLEEYEQYLSNKREMPKMVQLMTGVYETAWRGKIALLRNDLSTFGDLMNKNHTLVDEMMQYCGFTDGAGWANNRLIKSALKNGALGAKLTGAGGGGSVYALVLPGEEDRLVKAWAKIIEEQGLNEAQIYLPQIAQNGLVIDKDLIPTNAGSHPGGW